MIDMNEDKKLAQEWLECDEGEMTQDQLVHLAINGHKECTEYCGSKEFCDLGACACIRATFPTPKHYELYQMMRNTFLEMKSLALISCMSKNLHIVNKDKANKKIGETNAKKRS